MLSMTILQKVVELAELDLRNSQERFYRELSSDFPNRQMLDQTKATLAKDKASFERFSMMVESRKKRNSQSK
jgi:hypothetical protein